jgi:hypothetical protein
MEPGLTAGYSKALDWRPAIPPGPVAKASATEIRRARARSKFHRLLGQPDTEGLGSGNSESDTGPLQAGASARSVATDPGADSPPMAQQLEMDEATSRRIDLVNAQETVGAVPNAEFFGFVGDVVCVCGKWRPITQYACECGLTQRPPIDSNHVPLQGVNGPSAIVAKPARGCV